MVWYTVDSAVSWTPPPAEMLASGILGKVGSGLFLQPARTRPSRTRVAMRMLRSCARMRNVASFRPPRRTPGIPSSSLLLQHRERVVLHVRVVALDSHAAPVEVGRIRVVQHD